MEPVIINHKDIICFKSWDVASTVASTVTYISLQIQIWILWLNSPTQAQIGSFSSPSKIMSSLLC